MTKLFFKFFLALHRARLYLTRPVTLGVRVILVREGRVLLVRHVYQEGWLLPGGGVERNETLEAAARREAREEVGAELGELRLLGVFSNFLEYKSDHVAVFACEAFTLQGERPPRPMEIECFAFFPLDALPGDLYPGHRRRLEEWQRGTMGGFGRW